MLAIELSITIAAKCPWGLATRASGARYRTRTEPASGRTRYRQPLHRQGVL